MKLSKQFWFPGGILFLCALGLQWSPAALSAAKPYLTVFFLLVLAVGAVLGGMYNRSRLVISVAMFGIAAWLLLVRHGQPHWRIQTLLLLLPLNVILFSFLPERGLLARTSLLCGGVLLLEAASAALLPGNAVPWMELQTERALLPASWFHWSWLGQPALLTFGLAAVLLTGLFLQLRRPADRAMFWSLTAAFVGIHSVDRPLLIPLYFGTAVLILAVAVVEHAHSMAYADALTGLPNRRALDEFLPQLHRRFSLAMVDIDHFKQFNDTYGHDAGDQVLRKIAGHLAAVSGGGRAFRYGGEEFSVVFPGQSCKEARVHLEALRVRIENAGFALRGALRPRRKPKERRSAPRRARFVRVTVSIGVAELGNDLGTPREVLEAADRSLYQAKRDGRNQVQSA